MQLRLVRPTTHGNTQQISDEDVAKDAENRRGHRQRVAEMLERLLFVDDAIGPIHRGVVEGEKGFGLEEM